LLKSISVAQASSLAEFGNRDGCPTEKSKNMLNRDFLFAFLALFAREIKIFSHAKSQSLQRNKIKSCGNIIKMSSIKIFLRQRLKIAYK